MSSSRVRMLANSDTPRSWPDAVDGGDVRHALCTDTAQVGEAIPARHRAGFVWDPVAHRAAPAVALDALADFIAVVVISGTMSASNSFQRIRDAGAVVELGHRADQLLGEHSPSRNQARSAKALVLAQVWRWVTSGFTQSRHASRRGLESVLFVDSSVDAPRLRLHADTVGAVSMLLTSVRSAPRERYRDCAPETRAWSAADPAPACQLIGRMAVAAGFALVPGLASMRQCAAHLGAAHAMQVGKYAMSRSTIFMRQSIRATLKPIPPMRGR